MMRNLLIQLSGFEVVQLFLEKIAFFAEYLMGIGSGGGVKKSGEGIALEVLLQKVKGPYCVFDVGANQGQYLGLSQKTLKGHDYNIHSFEPSKETFKILNNRDADSKVTLNNFGLGKNNEDLTLYYNKIGSGLASLTKRKLDHFDIDFKHSETVSIKTLDTYCEENKIEKINLLKIDVEGHELDVFSGATKMFQKNAIDIIAFEFGGCNIDTKTFFQDFWYFFKDKNMDLYRIAPSGYLGKLKSYKETYEQFRTTNYLAIKKGL